MAGEAESETWHGFVLWWSWCIEGCVGGGCGGGDPSTCSPSNSLLAATFNTALFTGALWMKTQAAACFKYGYVCVYVQTMNVCTLYVYACLQKSQMNSFH